MRLRHRRGVVAAAVIAGLSAPLVTTVGSSTASSSSPLPPITFAHQASYATGSGAGSGEVAHVSGDRMVTINGTRIDIVDVRNPRIPALVEQVDLAAHGAEITSVTSTRTYIAAVLRAEPKTNPGTIVLLRSDGRFVASAPVGSLPDMVTFTRNDRQLLVANEGEPNSYGQADSVDPEGSVSVIDVARFAKRRPDAVRTATFTDFNAGGPRAAELPAGVRVFGPGASVAQDLEPEYITVDADSRTAWVSLQENNAIAEIDLATARVSRIVALGSKDHGLPGNGLDPSDRDGDIRIGNWPVTGLYMPDAIATHRFGNQPHLFTANEGDAREYTGYVEETRVKDIALDPTAFPNATTLRADAALGRLTVTRTGDTDGDGDLDEIRAFGGRSFSIWRPDGTLVWDSGDAIERIVAARNPAFFNANHEENSFDNRSDNKGPEPEAIAVGRIGERVYAFVGLERQSGIVVFDVTNPAAPGFVQYLENRVYTRTPVGPDAGPETLQFIQRGPGNRPTLVVSNEISGTVALWQPALPDGEGRLTLLHNNDGESSLLAGTRTVNVAGQPTAVPVGGVAAFKAVFDREVTSARQAGGAVLSVYAGDSFLASSTLACSLNPGAPVYDAIAQRQIAYDAHILGNHEFDLNPDFLERFMRTFTDGVGPNQAFLSSNLDFSGEPGFADLLDADGLLVTGSTADGRVLARSAVSVDSRTGQRFGVVSAITPLLATISSPRNVVVTSGDLATTATVVQTEIDRLRTLGLKKIILVSHLQNIANDAALIGLLRHVDVAVAGGGDELLASPAVADSAELLPGDTAAGEYPMQVSDAAGRTVYLVTSAGNYSYLGRLDVRFDRRGEVVGFDAVSGPRRVVPTSTGATAAGLTNTVTPDSRLNTQVVTPLTTCLQAQPLASTEVVLNNSRNPVTIGGVTYTGVRAGETNFGSFVGDAYLAAYDRYAAVAGLPARGPANPVVAVQNGGGIRQNSSTNTLPKDGVVPGNVTRTDTRNVMAFFSTNAMQVVSGVTPAELKEIFERSVGITSGESNSCGGGGQFLQVGGLRVEYRCDQQAQVMAPVPAGASTSAVQTAGQRVYTLSLDNGTPSDTSDDTPIVAAGVVVPGAPTVRVVTNSFTAAGGDNYPTLAGKASKTNLAVDYEQAVVDYWLAFPNGTSGLPTVPASDSRYASPAGEGRIRFLPAT